MSPYEQNFGNRLWQKTHRNCSDRSDADVPTHELMDFLLKYVAQEKVERIVVGHPKQMNNEDSENMKYIKPFVAQLKKKLPDMPVELVDERFTSVLALRRCLTAD